MPRYSRRCSKSDGITVERHFELGGNLAHDSRCCRMQIDVYPEYTGTAYTAILKHKPITDPQAVYDQTKAEYARQFNLAVSPPLGFANDFAILVRGDVARKNNLKTISDAVPLARNWQAGFGQDFMSRADGYPGFVKGLRIQLCEAAARDGPVADLSRSGSRASSTSSPATRPTD